MADTNFSGPVRSQAGFVAEGAAFRNALGASAVLVQRVDVNVVDGAAALTFTLPAGIKVLGIFAETPVAIPGTPTTTNLRIGSAANGAQYVADVDLKAQGFVALTLLYPTRNPATTVHVTVASTGGTAAAQDGLISLFVQYVTV